MLRTQEEPETREAGGAAGGVGSGSACGHAGVGAFRRRLGPNAGCVYGVGIEGFASFLSPR